MKINYIVLEGFKSFKEKVKIDLYKNTLIQACNFKGKTSIAEAIAYGFCGVSLNGESRNIEDLINRDSDELKVEINFNDDNDKNHTLIRVKNKKNQSVFLDDSEEPTTQNAINSFIGDPKLFLSCFNLGFFQQELEDSERRSLIVQYAPAIDMVKLFGEISDVNLIDKYNIQTHKTSEYSRLNKIKSQTDEAIKEINVKLTVLSEQNNSDSDEVVNYVNIDEQSEKQLKDKLDEMHKMQIHNSQIEYEYKNYNEKVTEYNKNIEKAKELKNKFEELQSLKPKEIIKDSQDFKAIEEKLLELIKEEASLSVEKICKSCGNEISDEQMQQNIAKKASLSELIEKTRKAIEDILEKDKIAEAENNDLFNKKNQIQYEINSIISLIKEPPSQPTQGLYDLSNIDEIKKQYEDLVNYNNTLRMKNAEVSNKINLINERVKEISQLEQHKTQLESQSKELESALKALSPSSGIFRKALEIKSNFIKSELENCSIILEKMQKNGEIKECFEIYFKDTPYRRLSYSEQMLCSLEIARFLRTQSKRNIPILIDNSESISAIGEDLLDSDQVIYCLVKPNHKLEIIEMKK